MDIADVQSVGLHEMMTWIVEENAVLCEAIRGDTLDVPLDVQRRRAQLQVQEGAFAQQVQRQG